jgi:3-oxoacyl-[acyl-carrier protein] reductase
MDLGINGKTALVLGASQGLGAGIAAALAAEGCNLIIGSRNEDALKTMAGDLSSRHDVEVTTYPIDLTDDRAVAALCDRIRNDFSLDILLNNAGGPPPSVSTGVSDGVWQSAIQGLMLSVIRVTEAAVAGMRQRKWGRILTVASSGVVQPIPNLAVSNTVRSAVVGFSKTLSSEVAADGVTVNLIVPGKIATARSLVIDGAAAERMGISMEEVKEKNSAAIPAGRYGAVEEFANVAAFLLSDKASYVTGQKMRVDGGMIISV